MKKILSVALAVVMLFAVVALAGCSKEETLKFGLGVVANYGATKNADGENNGEGEFNTTAVAVLLDAEGKIVKIDLDTAQIKPTWTADGKKVDVTDFRTKYDKGADYNMATYGATMDKNGDGKVLEWNAQADEFMKLAVGKTLAEVKAYMAEDGYATGDLAAAGCTINVTEFIGALEKAVNNAAESTATAENNLKVALVTSSSYDNKDATEEADGLNQVDTTVVAAVTDADGKVVVAKTDCTQGKITFNAKGEATVDTTAAVQTKLEQGDNYNMATYGASMDKNGDGKVLEWYAQAAAFDAALVGKTAADFAAFADETGYGTGDLATAGCTIAVTDMVAAAVAAATVA